MPHQLEDSGNLMRLLHLQAARKRHLKQDQHEKMLKIHLFFFSFYYMSRGSSQTYQHSSHCQNKRKPIVSMCRRQKNNHRKQQMPSLCCCCCCGDINESQRVASPLGLQTEINSSETNTVVRGIISTQLKPSQNRTIQHISCFSPPNYHFMDYNPDHFNKNFITQAY